MGRIPDMLGSILRRYASHYFMRPRISFTSELWKKFSEENGVQIKFSGTQHHNGLSLCERYNVPLRTTYRKIRLECPDLGENFVLQTAVKEMNDLLGPKELLPSHLVFGTNASIYSCTYGYRFAKSEGES